MTEHPGDPVVRSHPAGAIVEVLLVPGASRDEIVGVHGTRLRVRVKAPPEKGRANSAAARLLAKAFGSRVDLLSGATSRVKRFLVRDTTPEDLTGRIRRIAR